MSRNLCVFGSSLYSSKFVYRTISELYFTLCCVIRCIRNNYLPLWICCCLAGALAVGVSYFRGEDVSSIVSIKCVLSIIFITVVLMGLWWFDDGHDSQFGD